MVDRHEGKEFNSAIQKHLRQQQQQQELEVNLRARKEDNPTPRTIPKGYLNNYYPWLNQKQKAKQKEKLQDQVPRKQNDPDDIFYHYATLLDRACLYHVLHLHRYYFNALKQVESGLTSIDDKGSFPLDKWIIEINRMKEQIRLLILEMLKPYHEGEQAMQSTYIEEVEKELLSIEPLESFEYESTSSIPELTTSLAELQEQLQGDLKKNSRVTFKLMQDLQQQLEEFSDQSRAGDESEVKERLSQLHDELTQMQSVAIQVFDMIDLIYQSSLSIENQNWSTEIEKATKNVLRLLESHGISEVEVLGKMVDGSIMEVIGTVPQDNVNGPYTKYQVCAVHQRGFMDTARETLIRKASVSTVY